MLNSDLFIKGETIAVALSGGKDSVCLFDLLLSKCEEFGITVKAINVDHGIRGETSGRDSLFVKNLCKEKGIPLFFRKVDCPGYSAANGLSAEEGARALRYKVFNEAIDGGFCDRVATAHHAGDRVDTRLNRLFRLRAGHRGFTRHIARSGGDSAVYRPHDGRHHAEIQRVDVRSGDGCHQVDVRRARDDGLRHECCYLAAGLAHALRHYAVVAAANQRATLVDANVRRLLNPRDLHDKLFQLSQRIQRLRDVIPPKLRLFLCVHLSSLSERAATAAISRKRAIIAS